jgi:hypothetical protein
LKRPSLIGKKHVDPLYEFACSFLEEKPLADYIGAADTFSRIAEVKALLLFREGSFQVQIFTVPPYYIVPAHTHPNVESIEVYVGGQIRFSHRGNFVFEGRDPVDNLDISPFKWRMLRVSPEDRHGAVVGATGAVFISIQRWLNDIEPHCVAADYTGPVMDASHLILVKSGHPEPRLQSHLVEADAL